MTGKLEGKVALITGGASGLGEGQARLFSNEGAKIVVADVQADLGETVVSEIQADGGEAAYMFLDVRDWEQWQSTVAETEKLFGRLDILCNNAGTNMRGTPYEELSIDDYRNIIDVNLHGAYMGCRAVGEPMRQAGGGSIINIGSMSSFSHGSNSGYTISKTGILALTKNTALAYAKHRTRCNVICPGNVDTPFIRADKPHSHNDWSTTADNPEVYAKRLTNTPLGRLLTANDIAKTALFLCSDDADMITGAVLPVDGGTAML
jgi:NAD(P)-dependent dehydrogenase (short-subunit alcohol dehydrogenase family)